MSVLGIWCFWEGLVVLLLCFPVSARSVYYAPTLTVEAPAQNAVLTGSVLVLFDAVLTARTERYVGSSN